MGSSDYSWRLILASSQAFFGSSFTRVVCKAEYVSDQNLSLEMGNKDMRPNKSVSYSWLHHKRYCDREEFLPAVSH